MKEIEEYYMISDNNVTRHETPQVIIMRNTLKNIDV